MTTKFMWHKAGMKTNSQGWKKISNFSNPNNSFVCIDMLMMLQPYFLNEYKLKSGWVYSKQAKNQSEREEKRMEWNRKKRALSLDSLLSVL